MPRRLLENAPFDRDTVAKLCAAYDAACQQLHDTGQPAVVTEIMAQKILSLANAGERNVERLAQGALTAIQPR